MLEVCHTHIRLDDTFSVMGIQDIQCSSAPRHMSQCSQCKWTCICPVQGTYDNCTCEHIPVHYSCPAHEVVCRVNGNTGHWQIMCYSTSNTNAPAQSENTEDGKKQCRCHQGCDGKAHNAPDVSDNYNHQMDKLNMAVVTLEIHLPVSTQDPDIIQIYQIMITAMTEANITIILPVSIGPNKCGTLHWKVDTSTGRNVIPLHVFQELLPDCTDIQSHPTGPCPIQTRYTAYNDTPMPCPHPVVYCRYPQSWHL